MVGLVVFHEATIVGVLFRMEKHPIHVTFPGRLVFVGFGAVGRGVLPLVLLHIGGLPAERIMIITADESGREQAEAAGVTYINQPITRENFRHVLEPILGRGDFLLNLSVDVSSIALIRFAWERGALYLDTCIEPWLGGYVDKALQPDKRSNYAIREEALALRRAHSDAPTAVLTHGANPGLVSHFVKQALLNIAADMGQSVAEPVTRAQWATLAHQLGVKVIHISEKDTQVPSVPKKLNEFVNTWSVDGFISEGSQPAELGWGSHERNFPRDGRRHESGCGAAIYLMQPGAATRVRTWAPQAGPFHGFLITHGEAISIADYYTVREGEAVAYRPTVHYSYHPCDSAVMSVHEFAGRNWQEQDKKRGFHASRCHIQSQRLKQEHQGQDKSQAFIQQLAGNAKKEPDVDDIRRHGNPKREDRNISCAKGKAEPGQQQSIKRRGGSLYLVARIINKAAALADVSGITEGNIRIIQRAGTRHSLEKRYS